MEPTPTFTTIGGGGRVHQPAPDIIEVGPTETPAPIALDLPPAAREGAAVAPGPPPSASDSGHAQAIDPPAEGVASPAADRAPAALAPVEPAPPAINAEAAAAPTPSADIESIAKRRFSKRRPVHRTAKSNWRVSRIALVVAGLVAVDAGLILWRTDVVRLLPQTASLFDLVGLPVNLRQLGFKDIHTAYEEHDGTLILVIDGKIVATGKSVVDVPRLRFAIQAQNGHEIYAWTALPTRTKLAPGETLPFRTRLASPPEQGHTVKVRFFNRLDIASGLS